MGSCRGFFFAKMHVHRWGSRRIVHAPSTGPKSEASRAISILRPCLAGLRLRLHERLQLEPYQTVVFAPAPVVEPALEPAAALKGEEEPGKRGSQRLHNSAPTIAPRVWRNYSNFATPHPRKRGGAERRGRRQHDLAGGGATGGDGVGAGSGEDGAVWPEEARPEEARPEETGPGRRAGGGGTSGPGRSGGGDGGAAGP
jgi:hypothetical protein